MSSGGRRRLGFKVRGPLPGLVWAIRTRQRRWVGGMLPGEQGWMVRGWGWEGDVFVVHGVCAEVVQ